MDEHSKTVIRELMYEWMRAVRDVNTAWTVPERHSDTHEMMQEQLRVVWPKLGAALDALANFSTEEQ